MYGTKKINLIFLKRNLINFLQFGALKYKELNQIKKKKCWCGKLWRDQPKVEGFGSIYIDGKFEGQHNFNVIGDISKCYVVNWWVMPILQYLCNNFTDNKVIIVK